LIFLSGDNSVALLVGRAGATWAPRQLLLRLHFLFFLSGKKFKRNEEHRYLTVFYIFGEKISPKKCDTKSRNG
jgi:hypothetical protein